MARWLWLLPLLLSARPLPAQEILLDLLGEPGERLGATAIGIGDVNEDGFDDVLAGSPGWSDSPDPNHYPGRYQVFSGADGSLLHSGEGSQRDALGSGGRPAGDIDGDLVPDFMIGAQGEQVFVEDTPYIRVVSGRTGNVITTFRSGDFLGRLIEPNGMNPVGDVDDDGRDDVVVLLGPFAQGLAIVLSGRTEEILYTFDGNHADGAGDVDGDGRPDVLVGKGFDSWVYSGRTGEVLHELLGTGSRVAGVGDLDDDGFDDVVVATTTTSTIFSGQTGAVIRVLPDPGPRPAGDVDRDGTPDIVTEGGIYSGRTGVKISNLTGQAASDVDGDRADDIAFGDSSFGGQNTGRVLVYSGYFAAFEPCLAGNVDATQSGPVDVLHVNGSSGGETRTLELTPNSSLEFALDAPPSRAGSFRHAIYAWAYPATAFPLKLSRQTLRFGIGPACLPSPLTDTGSTPPDPPGTRSPKAVLDAFDLPDLLAPGPITHVVAPLGPGVIFSRPQGTGREIRVFLQGIVEDTASLHGQVAVTNGITLSIR